MIPHIVSLTTEIVVSVVLHNSEPMGSSNQYCKFSSTSETEFAGLEGIEPPLSVLETEVLPLNDRPLDHPNYIKNRIYLGDSIQ